MLGILALGMRRLRTLVLSLLAAAVCWTAVLTAPVTSVVANLGAIVVSQNLSFANGRFEETRQMLIDEDPDIIVLQEYTPAWHQSLQPIASRYHTVITIPQDGAFGIAVYSRLPIRSREILSLGVSGVPAIVIEIGAPELKAYIAAVHFTPPMTNAWSTDRDRQLDEISQYLQELNGDFIIVGDFNNTPYAPSLQTFVAETKTTIGSAGWLPTWPDAIGWAGIPIDLALGSSGVTIGSMSKVHSIGSDHRGLRFSITTHVVEKTETPD